MNVENKSLSYSRVTLSAALTASIATALTLVIQLPIWVMFIGWISFFCSGLTSKKTLENLGCVWLGMLLGMLASFTIAKIIPILGIQILMPIVVFCITLIVVSLRGIPILNNLLGYFLGLVTWFAAHYEPAWESISQLCFATAIGSIAGWISHHIPPKVFRNNTV